jgi:hypothetical protein
VGYTIGLVTLTLRTPVGRRHLRARVVKVFGFEYNSVVSVSGNPDPGSGGLLRLPHDTSVEVRRVRNAA